MNLIELHGIMTLKVTRVNVMNTGGYKDMEFSLEEILLTSDIRLPQLMYWDVRKNNFLLNKWFIIIPKFAVIHKVETSSTFLSIKLLFYVTLLNQLSYEKLKMRWKKFSMRIIMKKLSIYSKICGIIST